MNRSEFISVNRIDDGSLRLNYHTAAYAGLSQKQFNFTLHIVNQSEQHRPDLVALNVYGDSGLWFPLYQFNGIIDPITETIPGLQLKVPDSGQLGAFLKASNSQTTNETVEL